LFRHDPLANPELLTKRVYAYVAYRMGDGPDAEDVTSEVFENALRYLDTYDPARGEPVTWLLGIARRCIAQAFVGRQAVAAEVPELVARGDLESETVERLTLAAAMRTLGERDCELLALRYGADLRARQIGELLGLNVSAVEVALHRALARLRQALEAADVEAQKVPVFNAAERTV
jgi:RNA polymerase sigma factor (sigma-70 family)